ncbi:MAG: signal recognition particle-docking protein FtsY [Clostridia bacterium]|nr:signal recognition particle-docking protein FtsY [Clostridia bacterium]
MAFFDRFRKNRRQEEQPQAPQPHAESDIKAALDAEAARLRGTDEQDAAPVSAPEPAKAVEEVRPAEPEPIRKTPEPAPEPPKPEPEPVHEAVRPEPPKPEPPKPAPVEPARENTPEPPAEEKKGFFGRLKSRLTRTHDNLSGKMDDLVENAEELDDDFFEEMTDILIMADVGVKTADEAVGKLREKCEADKTMTPARAREELREILIDIMGSEPMRLASPMVLFVIGVNGVGKTTSIGKLASRLKTVGRRVIICAGDTFSAAAADQLTIWADRAGVPIVKQKEGADPAAVVFDGIQAAKQRGADVLIVDTAGRLHNKAHLMEELKKMARVIAREFPEARTRSLLVIDATTGQNGLVQANVFKDVTDLEGIILTKLDGTAKGGIAIAIRSELGLPVRYIGVGEQLDDLQPFDAREFIEAIL